MVFSLLKKKITYQDPDVNPGPVEPVQSVQVINAPDTQPANNDVIKPIKPEENVPEVKQTAAEKPPKSKTRILTKSQLISKLTLKKRSLIIIAALLALAIGGGVYAYLNDEEFKNFWGIGSNQPAPESSSDSSAITPSGDALTNPDKPISDKPVSNNNDPKSDSGSGAAPDSGGGSQPSAPSTKTVTVSYTSGCFTPSTVTISKGDTVEFVNKSGKDMEPASDVHPHHNEYPAFDAGRDIPPGGMWSFTFDKADTWGYHDHNKPSCRGTVIVK